MSHCFFLMRRMLRIQSLVLAITPPPRTTQATGGTSRYHRSIKTSPTRRPMDLPPTNHGNPCLDGRVDRCGDKDRDGAVRGSKIVAGRVSKTGKWSVHRHRFTPDRAAAAKTPLVRSTSSGNGPPEAPPPARPQKSAPFRTLTGLANWAVQFILPGDFFRHRPRPGTPEQTSGPDQDRHGAITPI